MKHQFRGETIHIATGGRDFDTSGKVVTLIHGSGQTTLLDFAKLIFSAQRVFCTAPDFPGHGLSSGEPLKSVPAQAEWITELLQAYLSINTVWWDILRSPCIP